MPNCATCGEKFKTRQTIDGLVKNLCKRRHCTNCLPFKANYRIARTSIGSTRRCSFCEKQYKYFKTAGHRINVCNSCATTGFKENGKARCIAYFGGKCVRCGYDRCKAALEFHHRDPKEKRFLISGGAYTRRWSDLEEELRKCDLLCSNCHRELHANEFNKLAAEVQMAGYLFRTQEESVQFAPVAPIFI